MYIILIPPQLRIILLLEPNLVKETRHSSVYSQGGKKTMVSRHHIWKDVSRSQAALDIAPCKKINKVFSPL